MLKGYRVLGSRLVFKTKRDIDSKIDKYKSEVVSTPLVRDTTIIIIAYVDDFLVISKARIALEELKKKILTIFDDLLARPAKYFLSVRIIFISKARIALEELKKKILTIFDDLLARPAKYFLSVRIICNREKKTISLY
ncbi:uncharacterized protein RAG0_16791 [Rhynchosporium agropyri]|uniref:Reverse transcriptase Ty1/copia-type domain-containing protein n=1 Tax=Rhynchosporium agropyri TaxID=914238 RepID=A0A1E1LRX7_9HELO|nr:uncharacterized protein RAG0_16791 [Rhynchosporium agropyri]